MTQRTFTEAQVRDLMLQGWEMGWDAHQAFVNVTRGSNRRSVALGDDEVLEGAQNGAQAAKTRCPECIDLSPGVHYPNCKADESESDRG